MNKQTVYALRCVHCAIEGTPTQLGISKRFLDTLTSAGLLQRVGNLPNHYMMTPTGNMLLEGNGGPFPYENTLRRNSVAK